ncbi:MAG: fibrobacter succinogenes major paralogous domain-containing protein [Dysgonamonadaceae bacterium]|jgi:uncharacterized protein (TIGR02145 family)|nr:fibrobacter succinogenes major paralogous domain-containing protein [Dysgonamonadaceae bacterium]
MKKILLTMTAFFMLNASCAIAQVTIGSLDDPQSFSILELEGNGTRGLRLPQLDNDQREALQETFGEKATTDAMGLQIFNISTGCVETWNGAEWIQQCFTCSESVEDIEGNQYCVGNFGAAGIWMTENLRSTKYSDGTQLQKGSDTEDADDKFYYYPNLAEDILDIHPEYGLLYTWAAASGRTGADKDTEGVGLTPPATPPTGAGDICPDGWHLPNDYEWNMLEKEIANNTTSKYGTGSTTAWDNSWATITNWRGTHGSNMKSTTPVTDNTNGYSNTRGNNGFNALLAGSLADYGSVAGYGKSASFWSSISDNSEASFSRAVNTGSTNVYRGKLGKYCMLSVRCKKNE